MANSLFLLLILFNDFRQTFCEFNSFMLVDTEQGRVEGYLDPNKMYYEFCGIRYGIARSRYTAPEEPPKHKGVFKADDRLVLCPQFQAYDIFARPSENEDCLILNVYVPAAANETLPVMVFLHGGDFGVGSSSPTFYGPQFFMTEDLVVVSVNYRLNAFGFLNLGTKEAPGNAGLKDIRAALRWIQKNIRNFGGDEENVTVFGQGSGGIAAIYLTLSESCKGLFHKIISSSGTLFSSKSFDPNPLATASQVAKSLGVNTMDREDLESLYVDIPINKLEEAIGHQMNAKSTFLPSVEDYEDDDPFLTDTPYHLMQSKNFYPVPALIGLNTVEGIVTILDYYTFTSQTNRILNEDYSVLDQRNFKVPKEEIVEFRKNITEVFFTNLTSEAIANGALIMFNTHFLYSGPMALFTEMYAKNSDVSVYQYIFSHKGERNLGTLLTKTEDLQSTTNMDELFYLFHLENPILPMSYKDSTVTGFMVDTWANFARYGTPQDEFEWLPYPQQLNIERETLQYVAAMNPFESLLWRYYFEKYGAEIYKD